MSDLPRAWLAAVIARDQRVGLGVLVRPNLLVTCAHVVASALGLREDHPEKPQDPIEIQVLATRTRCTARPLLWHPIDPEFAMEFQDICLLELETAIAIEATWDDLTSQAPRRGHKVAAFGYYGGMPPGGYSAEYVLKGAVDGLWWQLAPAASATSSLIDRGFSGSLAWDVDEDGPVGIVVARAGPHAYVIPSTVLRAACAMRRGAEFRRANFFMGLPLPLPRDVFLSYNGQDRPQADELARKLQERGLHVWFDQWELEPGRPWQEALECAIRTVRAVAVLFGEHGMGPWETREMRAAIAEAVRRGVPVIPVLLPGASERPELPLFLEQFTWLDLRGGLVDASIERLVSVVRAQRVEVAPEAAPPAPGLFRLWSVPPLPREHQPRPELEDLKRALLSPQTDPLAITRAVPHNFALQGMGGVGKSVLAAALARDPDVRRAFPDGVFWITLGQSPQAALVTLQSQLIEALAGKTTTITSLDEGKRALASLLRERACLLVLDDVWDAADADAFIVPADRSRTLLTTRREDIIRALGAERFELGELVSADARELLARYARLATDRLPPEADDIVRECGELPLALAMAGSMLRGRPADRWARVRQLLRTADLERLKREFPGYPYPTLMVAIDVSVEDLPADVRERYLDLAVFPEDAPIPESVLQTYWTPLGLDRFAVQDVVDTLLDRSLARRDTQGRIVLHDLQRDFVRRRAKDVKALHQRLLDAYRRLAPDGFHQVPNDGYVFGHLAGHIVAAEGPAALRALLFDDRWLTVKLAVEGSSALLADFALADLSADRPLSLLRDAVRLSAHVLHRRPQELPGQLIGRLLRVVDHDICALVNTLRANTPRPWLCPLWSGLASPGGNLLRTLDGHANSVAVVTLSPDGKIAISGSADRALRVWDVNSGELLRTLEGHADSVSAVALAADGKTVVSGSFDDTLKVWDVASGALLHTLEGHVDLVAAVALTADGKTAVSGSRDHTLKVWDVASGALLHTLEGHAGSIAAVALTADGKTAISGSGDQTLKVWDVTLGALLHTLRGHADSVAAVALTPDGKTAISGSGDHTLKVWDVTSGALLRTLRGHADSVNALALTADGKTAISGSGDHTLKVWGVTSGVLLRTLKGHADSVLSVALAADGKIAVSGSGDGALRVWDVTSQPLLRTIERHADSVNALALAEDGKILVSGSRGRTLQVWDAATGALLRTIEGSTGRIRAVALTPDGKTAVSGSGDGVLRVWDVASGALLRKLKRYVDSVDVVALTPDGKTAISGSGNGVLKVWDVTAGRLSWRLVGHDGPVVAVALTANGKTAISGSIDNTLKVWDVASGVLLRTIARCDGAFAAVALAADGKTAISGSDALKVWDVASGALLRTLEGHAGGVRAAALTADGKTAVSGSDDNTLKVWDVTSSKPLASFTTDAGLYAIALTRDGRIVACDRLGRLHLLRLERGADA
jgi:WD40 repeat protein